MQASTGIVSTTGREGDEPVHLGVSLTGMGTAIRSVIGVRAAVLERGRSCRDSLVETSLLDTGIAWMTIVAAGYWATTAQLPKKLGSATAMIASYEVFPSADGHVFVAAGNDRLFERVCEGLGRPGLTQDPRFATKPLRVENRDALRKALGALTRERTTRDIVASLQTVGASCSELNDVAQMLSNAQVGASGMLQDLPVESARGHRATELPVELNGERGGRFEAPPELGGSTDEILAALGCSFAEIGRLRDAKVVA